MKYCYLILANSNPQVLGFLLEQLDNERNDIYIHLDLKSKINPNDFKTVKSKLIFIERTKCYWGEYSQTNATLRLIEAALCSGEQYKYFHLISGATLCSKSQDEIHQFFDNTNLEYFHVNYHSFKLIQDRCKYYYPFIKTKAFRKCKALKALSIALGKIQFIFGVNRLRQNEYLPLYNGFEWFSITEDFAKYILSKEEWIRHTFNHTLAGEEVFIQTLGVNSEFKSRIYGFNGKDDFIDASKTYQFWNNGKSSEINTQEKIDIIMNDQHSFFARKFNDKDIELIRKNLKF